MSAADRDIQNPTAGGAFLARAGAMPAQKPIIYSLTQRQAETLAFIRGYMSRHGGVAPSCAEIAFGLGLHSKGYASDLVAALVARGRVSKLPYHSRSLSLPGEVSL